MRYIDAITDALDVQMKTSRRFLWDDIAEYGGVFKVTEGLLSVLVARVRNTPIIESGALGAAMGLALAGFRPMVEMQFGDFITCGFNQIVNNLAKTHYRWNVSLPIVIRAPHGGGVGAGPFHSQSIEAWFTSVAGLKVVALQRLPMPKDSCSQHSKIRTQSYSWSTKSLSLHRWSGCFGKCARIHWSSSCCPSR